MKPEIKVAYMVDANFVLVEHVAVRIHGPRLHSRFVLSQTTNFLNKKYRMPATKENESTAVLFE